MRSRMWMVATAALVAAGCGGGPRGDPGTAWLPPESEALVYSDRALAEEHDEKNASMAIMLVTSRHEELAYGFDRIVAGTRVRVIDDPVAPDRTDERFVRAMVLEGKFNGEAISIGREYLRPRVH